jgi:hypothetical protein
MKTLAGTTETGSKSAGDPALDLRCFLEMVQGAGELQVVEAAEWNLEQHLEVTAS